MRPRPPLPIIPLLFLFAPSVLSQLTPSPAYTPPSPTAGLVSSSPSATPNPQWAAVLGNSLWFYDAQRSGRLDEGAYPNRVPWRNDSALDDGDDWGVDLTGGYFDAGDYIKATFPLGFTLYALSWGALTHGTGYRLADQTAYLDGTLRWGYDWLMKAHPSDDVLFVQVASTEIDNNYWGGDQGIATPRPAYPVNSSHPGTDIWASTSAAFSIASLLYSNSTYSPFSASAQPSNPSLQNASYSALLLDHARRLYTVANTTRRVSFADSVPAATASYGSSGWGDDLTLAALSLALAANSSAHYADAYRYYAQYRLTGGSLVFNWDSRSPGVYVLFVEAARARPELARGAGLEPNVTGWQAEAENWFDRVMEGRTTNTRMTSAGLVFWDGDSDPGSLNPAMAFTMLLLKYAPMASSADKGRTYTAFALTQIDYLMGKNPSNAVYLVGSHPNSPRNPHHAGASGGNNIGDIRNSPPTNVHTLYGAMVGGPLANDRFWDWRDDWVQTEVALDYNAMIPTIASMMLMNGAADPYYVNVAAGTYSIPNGQPCDAALPCASHLPGGAIAGIVLGCLAFIAIVAGLLWWTKRTGKW